MHDHHSLLDEVHQVIPDDELLCDLADLFKIFGDSTRIKILYGLFESEMCVCAIAGVDDYRVCNLSSICCSAFNVVTHNNRITSHELYILRAGRQISGCRCSKHHYILFQCCQR